MTPKRVLITGVSRLLGASLARTLEASSEVEYVGAVDAKPPALQLDRAEFVLADIRNPLIRRVLASSRADTVVHTDLVSSPARAGGRTAQKERNVIGTMQLLGACQRAEHVQKVVVRSSTAVYGIDPASPSLLTEQQSARIEPDQGYSKDVMDAETFARDFGRRRPDVTLTILRTTNVVGPKIDSSMTQFFSLPLIPVALGYDPRLQFVHEDDEVEVLRRAVVEDHPGVFNVAGDGIIYLSQALRIARRLPLPVLAPLAQVIADLLRAAGVVDFSTDQIKLMLHGRVVDNSRLKSVFGFQPKYSTADAFRDFVEARGTDVAGPGVIAKWENDIYDFLIRTVRERLGARSGPYGVGDRR